MRVLHGVARGLGFLVAILAALFLCETLRPRRPAAPLSRFTRNVLTADDQEAAGQWNALSLENLNEIPSATWLKFT